MLKLFSLICNNTHPKAISYLLLSHTPPCPPHTHTGKLTGTTNCHSHVTLPHPSSLHRTLHVQLPGPPTSFHYHYTCTRATLRWVSCFVLISWSRACRSLETPRQERGRILVSSNQVGFIRAFVIGLQREYEVGKLHDRSTALGLLWVCWCCLFVFSWYIRVHHTVLLKVSSFAPRPFIVSLTNGLGMRLGQP